MFGWSLIEKFKKSIQNFNPPDRIKSRVSRQVFAFMETYPYKGAGFEGKRNVFGFLQRAGFYAVFVPLMLVIFMGAGAVASAEKALPGDVLYFVKVFVNEKVAVALAFSPEEKARLKVALVEKRVQEAEVLANKGKLDEKSQVQISRRLKDNVDQAIEGLASLSEQGQSEPAAEITSNFEATLKAHGEVLKELSRGKNEDSRTLLPIISEMEIKQKAVSRERAQSERIASSGAKGKSAAAAKLNDAENEIAQIKNFIEENELSEDEAHKIKENLKVAQQQVENGKKDIQEMNYEGGFSSFQKSIRIVQESKVLIKAKTDFKINVNINSATSPAGAGEDAQD